MVATQNYIPKAAQNLLSGQLQSPFSDTDSYFVGDVLPPASKLPTYFWIDYGSSSAELVKVYDVSGNNVYCKRGINNGGVGIAHNANAPYREAITIEHWNTLVDAVQSGWLTEPLDVYTVSQVSATEFKIVGVDRTSYYTAGVRVKINGTITTYVVSSTLSGSDTIVTVGDAVVPSTISALELKLSVSPDDPVITTEHNPDGTHKNVTATSITTTGDATIGGTVYGKMAGVQYDSFNLSKQTYSDWTTIRTINKTANFDGRFVIIWTGIFGFHTADVTGAFRMLVNGTQIATTYKPIFCYAAKWNSFSLVGKFDVVKGNSYTIELQTNGGGDAYYVQGNNVIILTLQT